MPLFHILLHCAYYLATANRRSKMDDQHNKNNRSQASDRIGSQVASKTSSSQNQVQPVYERHPEHYHKSDHIYLKNQSEGIKRYRKSQSSTMNTISPSASSQIPSPSKNIHTPQTVVNDNTQSMEQIQSNSSLQSPVRPNNVQNQPEQTTQA